MNADECKSTATIPVFNELSAFIGVHRRLNGSTLKSLLCHAEFGKNFAEQFTLLFDVLARRGAGREVRGPEIAREIFLPFVRFHDGGEGIFPVSYLRVAHGLRADHAAPRREDAVDALFAQRGRVPHRAAQPLWRGNTDPPDAARRKLWRIVGDGAGGNIDFATERSDHRFSR